jgi:hypothetical protein
MRAIQRVTVAAFVILAAVVPVWAEVMDKERSVVDNWLWAVAGGLLAVAGWWWRWWAGLIVSALALSLLYGTYAEIRDPIIEPAIRSEAGAAYFVHFYSAICVAVSLHVVAAYLGLTKRFVRSHRRV